MERLFCQKAVRRLGRLFFEGFLLVHVCSARLRLRVGHFGNPMGKQVRRRLRVVIDTKVLVSALISNGKPREFLRRGLAKLKF